MSRAACRLALVAALLVAANLAGMRILVVSGNSMSPSIRDGDLVVTSALAGDAKIGRIVLVRRPGDGALLLHRIVEVGDGWWRTKGDASRSPDVERTTATGLLGGLVAVLPTGLLRNLPLDAAAAGFTAIRHAAVSIASSAGARAVLVGPDLLGTDALGQLLPGGRATWVLTLTPCPVGIGGECAGAANTLRIDPDRFAPPAGGSLARSLRLLASCRPVGGSTWVDSADLFTAAWSPTAPASGRLATLASGSGPSECRVQVTLLGAIGATGSNLVLPLRWGPE